MLDFLGFWGKAALVLTVLAGAFYYGYLFFIEWRDSSQKIMQKWVQYNLHVVTFKKRYAKEFNKSLANDSSNYRNIFESQAVPELRKLGQTPMGGGRTMADVLGPSANDPEPHIAVIRDILENGNFTEVYNKFNELVVQKFQKSRSRAANLKTLPLNAAVMSGSQLTLKESQSVLGDIARKMAKQDEKKLMYLQFAFATTAVVFQTDYLGKYAQAHTGQVFKEADQHPDVDITKQ
eukprot:CFRG6621T1